MAALALVLSACGDKSTSSSSSTTLDPRSPTQITTDKAAADMAVLRLGDLPPGWTSQSNTDDSSSSAEQRSAEAQFADCAGVDPSIIGAGARSATRAKSDEFSDSEDHQVESSVTVVATRELAKKQLNSIRSAEVPGCLATFVNRAIQSAVRNPKPGQTPPTGVRFGEARVVPLDLPGLHAATVGYRTTVPVRVGDRSADVNLDIVLALTGRTGISMTFTSFGTPFANDAEIALTNKVIDRAPAG